MLGLERITRRAKITAYSCSLRSNQMIYSRKYPPNPLYYYEMCQSLFSTQNTIICHFSVLEQQTISWNGCKWMMRFEWQMIPSVTFFIHGTKFMVGYCTYFNSNGRFQNEALPISDRFSKMPSYQQLVMAVYGNRNAKFTIAIVLNSILYRWHVDSRWMLFRKFSKHLTHPQLLHLKCN